MICYIKTHSPNKAKRDIDDFCADAGYRNVASASPRNKALFFLANILTVVKLLCVLRRGDILLIQYPYKKFYKSFCRVAHLKGASTVTLIHDLGSFRRHRLTPEQEIRRLSYTDYIIAHNPAMIGWLEEHDCRVPMMSLDIFDYRSEVPIPAMSPSAEVPQRLVYAGGLGRRKNSFLYEIDPHLGECVMDVYGNGWEPQEAGTTQRLTYRGFIDSDDFIRTIADAWGVVWDGDSYDECSGNWGEYLRYNNPHKASFYLRAGLPVVVWSESAMAPFLVDSGVGIAVDSLRDLPARIAAITPEQYARIRASVADMRGRLAAGHYFHRALDSAVRHIQQ